MQVTSLVSKTAILFFVTFTSKISFPPEFSIVYLFGKIAGLTPLMSKRGIFTYQSDSEGGISNKRKKTLPAISSLHGDTQKTQNMLVFGGFVQNDYWAAISSKARSSVLKIEANLLLAYTKKIV